MFNYEEYRNLDWKEKIEYVSRILNLRIEDVFYIIEGEPFELSFLTISDYFKEYQNSKFLDNLYLLNIIFNYLVTAGEYNSNKIQEIWQKKSIYVNLINKPPWFQDGLRKYLMNNRLEGLRNCIDWIRSN